MREKKIALFIFKILSSLFDYTTSLMIGADVHIFFSMGLYLHCRSNWVCSTFSPKALQKCTKKCYKGRSGSYQSLVRSFEVGYLFVVSLQSILYIEIQKAYKGIDVQLGSLCAVCFMCYKNNIFKKTWIGSMMAAWIISWLCREPSSNS